MRYLLMIVVLSVAGYFACQQFKPKPSLPPLPPPPAILTEPAPIINPEEQAKIIKSASDQDPDVRWQAIIFLDKMKVPSAYDVMFDKMHKDQDVELRIKVITLLGQRGAQKIIMQSSPNDPLTQAITADPMMVSIRVAFEARAETSAPVDLAMAWRSSRDFDSRSERSGAVGFAAIHKSFRATRTRKVS